jgi:predicted RNA methylase
VTDPEIVERVRSPGYTPAARDVEALFALLATADDDVAKHAERALARVGTSARQALERFSSAEPPLRGRLCALVGRIAHATPEPALVRWLSARLTDADPKTRRRAIRALGKVRGEAVESSLIAAFGETASGPDARAFAMALGSVGGERARARLLAVRTEDPELLRIVREARMKLERVEVRRDPSTIDGSRALPGKTLVLLHVRAGVEEILLDELGGAMPARAAGRGRVELELEGPLDRVFRARTFLHLGFPLPPETAAPGHAADAVARALTSDAAWKILSGLTRGAVRYRLEWAGAGRRRAATQRVAAAVAAVRPSLVNDPTAAPWEAVVTEKSGKSEGRIFVELWPRGLPDPRFGYRRRALPASSHPTIAAALARVAGALPDDVVWDPFVGAGGELVERARLGPYARLFGSDTDANALEAARENLRAARVDRWELAEGDARTFRPPEPPSLLITNPPFGKRMLRPDEIRPLLAAVLANAARVLRPGGRVVWMSPLGDATAEDARRHGFSIRLRRAVDVGGVPAELQALVLGGATRDGPPGPERRRRR